MGQIGRLVLQLYICQLREEQKKKFLLLKCSLLEVISVQCRCFKCVLKVISASTITYHWVYQLQPGTFSPHVLQPLNAGSIYFDRLLMGTHTSLSQSTSQASNTLKSEVTFPGVHDFSLVLSLTNLLRSYVRLVGMSLIWHSPFPAPGVYVTLTAQEEVEKLKVGLWSIVGVSWIYMHFTSLMCLDTNPSLLAGDVHQQF